MTLAKLAELIAAHLDATGKEATAANVAEAERYVIERAKGGES